MSLYHREEEYLRLLSQKDYTVKELSEALFISEPTVRRDLCALREKELLVCHRGLVSLKPKYADQMIPLFIREVEAEEEKKRLALEAIQYVKDGSVIFLDASTTAYHLLPHLTAFKKLLIITNGAKTALTAAALGLRTICTGGEIAPESLSFVGADAESTLSRYNADVAFFSCRGLSPEGLVTDTSILENAIRRIMLRRAKASYLLCGPSKIGKTYLNTLCHKNDLSAVITL